MVHDEEAAATRCPEVWKLNPKNFGPNIKSIKFLRSGVKTSVGRVSGNNKIFSPYHIRNSHILKIMFYPLFSYFLPFWPIKIKDLYCWTPEQHRSPRTSLQYDSYILQQNCEISDFVKFLKISVKSCNQAYCRRSLLTVEFRKWSVFDRYITKSLRGRFFVSQKTHRSRSSVQYKEINCHNYEQYILKKLVHENPSMKGIKSMLFITKLFRVSFCLSLILTVWFEKKLIHLKTTCWHRLLIANVLNIKISDLLSIRTQWYVFQFFFYFEK